MNEQVLIISPHLDDEVLGCGGAIIRHVEAGDVIHVCFVAHRVYGHFYNADVMDRQRANSHAAAGRLGYQSETFLDLPDERLDECLQDIIIPLEACAAQLSPDIVYSPFPGDNNQDHRAVARAAQVIMRPFGLVKARRWVFYEAPSSTESAPNVGDAVFRPTAYLDIADVLEKKIDALRCYTDECRPFPNPRSPEGLRALAMKRGMEAGMEMAEAFMLVRERIRI
ncbi:PIG-L family deacetylase [Candidatus Parcubacteria bacterium]|nr:MAG: PIG-L family deacetylase [Candidatus Parcubacteria bacterium]